MAGLDRMYDARKSIQKYIEQQIRGLLGDPMNEYQDPNWVQAAILFEQIVVPCEAYLADWIYDLAEDIVKAAEQHKNRVAYQEISGMYNEKIIDINSIDMDNPPDNTDVREYGNIINKIKNWMKNF